MKDFEKQLKELKAGHQKELAELTRKEKLYGQLPKATTGVRAEPTHIHFVDRENDLPWVCYEVPTLEAGIEILTGYGPFKTIRCRKKSCTSVAPEEYHKDYVDGELRWRAKNGILVIQQGGRGYGYVDLEAWPEDLRIKLQIKMNWLPYGKASRLHTQYNGSGGLTSSRLEEVQLTEYRIRYGSHFSDSFRLLNAFEGIPHLEQVLLN